jgi:hypothetical protein
VLPVLRQIFQIRQSRFTSYNELADHAKEQIIDQNVASVVRISSISNTVSSLHALLLYMLCECSERDQNDR